MKRLLTLLSPCVVFLSGCGYTFIGSGSVLPPDVKTVFVPVVENNSTEAGMSTILRESLQDRFERYGVVTIVDEPGDADAILKAKIVKVRRNTRTSTGETDRALQYDTTMTIAAELKRSSGLVLWRNQAVSVSKSYGTAANTVVTGSAEFSEGNLGADDINSLDNREIQRGQEGATLQSLADEAARVIYDQAVAPDF